MIQKEKELILLLDCSNGINVESNDDLLCAHFMKAIYHEKRQKKIEKWFQSQEGKWNDGRSLKERVSF